LRKVLTSKRGISPILATLLLVVIAVAAIIVTYAWIMAFMGAQTGAAGTMLNIENVYWNSTSSTTDMTVRNIGTSDVRIISLYIGTTASNLIPVTTNTDIGSGELLPVEQSVTITLSWPNALVTSWINGKTYYFKIVPETGSELTFARKAPSS
jgi:flagellin-like protein